MKKMFDGFYISFYSELGFNFRNKYHWWETLMHICTFYLLFTLIFALGTGRVIKTLIIIIVHGLELSSNNYEITTKS